MKDLIDATHEDFEICLHDVFTVKTDAGVGPDLELIEVNPLGEIDPDTKNRQPFTLLFRGPLEPAFPQQLFQLENSNFGEILLFLVPVGPDEEGMLYDATFN